MKIYTRPDLKERETGTHMFVNIDYLRGYTAETLTAYREMADQMRALLPGLETELTDDKIKCRKVIRSSNCEGFSVVTWDGMIPKKNNYQELGWHMSERPRDYQLS
jgi:hypothetical protein